MIVVMSFNGEDGRRLNQLQKSIFSLEDMQEPMQSCMVYRNLSLKLQSWKAESCQYDPLKSIISNGPYDRQHTQLLQRYSTCLDSNAETHKHKVDRVIGRLDIKRSNDVTFQGLSFNVLQETHPYLVVGSRVGFPAMDELIFQGAPPMASSSLTPVVVQPQSVVFPPSNYISSPKRPPPIQTQKFGKTGSNWSTSGAHEDTSTEFKKAKGGFDRPVKSAAGSDCSGYNSRQTNGRGRDNRTFSQREDEAANNKSTSPFLTAREQLQVNNSKKQGVVATNKRSLGTRRVTSKFVSPLAKNDQDSDYSDSRDGSNRAAYNDGANEGLANVEVDERLKNIDPKMIELIKNEIIDHGNQVGWEDIAGLDHAKKTVQEIVVWPMLRPDLFTGLRGPVKGLLLFGPPGTGKTLIGRCIASQSGATFFSISASSLTSKWIGEGEKMVRALFAVARCNQPAVVFIDEIDSLLSSRSSEEHESSRRLKTEFLIQLDGAGTKSDDRILIIGATNRPEEIDEAARRRLVKRLYIPLPEDSARQTIINTLLNEQVHSLTPQDIESIVRRTEGYSGADMNNLCKEAALGPIRSISNILHVTMDQ
eukprot:Ihof_evm4s23 gene=Ihof_evmTU4s23